MASRRRCETLTATSTSRRGGAVGGELAQTSSSTTSVSLATTGSDSEPTGLRQAEEGRVSPTAGGRRRVPRAPTASRYFLRSTQIPTCAGVSGAGPGLRPATSSTKATASETRSRLRSSNRAERQTSGTSGSSRRASQKRGKKIQDPKQPLPPRMKRKEVKDRLLSPRETQRFGTWNVRTLRGTGKPELLANEMKRYKLSIVAVTETHLAGEGEMPLDEEGKYIILFSGRQDGQNVEGVGLALSSQAQAAMRHHQSISPRIMTAEFLTQVGPLMIVVVYAPTDRASNEEKDKFYEDLNCVVSRGHGHVMVMGDFNASHDSQHSILNDTQVKQLNRSLPGYYRVDAVPSVSDSPSRELHASIATAGSETAADELSSIEVSGASESTELCEPPHRNKELDDSDQWVMIGVSEASEATGTVEQKPKSKWKMVRRGR